MNAKVNPMENARKHYCSLAFWLIACLLIFISDGVHAKGQSVEIVTDEIRITKGGSGVNTVENSSGKIDPRAEIEGITVINEDVWIDGEKVPRTKTHYKSRKSGKTYMIKRGDGNVSVLEK